MPELAEVEFARRLLAKVALHKTIIATRTKPDPIVFVDHAQQDFNNALVGRKVLTAGRLGKQFYLTLDKSGPSPLFHFGMSGSCATRVAGSIEERQYRRPKKAKLNEEGTDWPPIYWKAVLTFDDQSEWAFCDSRRFGRIKLIPGDILKEPPLSTLGRDPILDMPTIQELTEGLSTKSAPIKAALLDQNGIFCGLGNWLVDEILFLSRIHPAQPCCSLDSEQIKTLHEFVHHVCKTACDANADSSLFPAHWLFSHRWGKGKKSSKPATIMLEDGGTATIKFETVGGRTSAVTSVQKLIKKGVNLTPKKRGKAIVAESVEVAEEPDDLKGVKTLVDESASAIVDLETDTQSPIKKRRTSRKSLKVDVV